MPTFSSLQIDVFRRCGYADAPATAVSTRIKAFLNESYHRLLGLPGMEYLRQSQTTFDSVASTPQYSLPQDLARIIGIRDADNDLVLRGEPWSWYIRNEPDPTSTTGTPEVWCPVGTYAVAAQPSDASKIYVDSTAAGDTNSCYVEGVRTGGGRFAATITMNGVTAVQAGSYTDIIAIDKFYLSAAAVGDVTLHSDAEGGTELAKIPIGNTYARYFRVALWPCPDDAYTYTVDYHRQVRDMVNANDEALVPDDFAWVLAAGARMMEYEKLDDRRYPAAKADFEKGVRDLKWFVAQQADGQSARTPQWSSLGPWYPAGT